MTSLSHDYPELEDILDIGDASGIDSGGCCATKSVSLNGYDGHYIEDLSQLCSENSDITHQHYMSKAKLQNEEFSRHNEDGLLEALQQSMDNYESGSLSDLGSLASLSFTMPNGDLSPSNDGLFFNDLLSSDHPFAISSEDAVTVQSNGEEEEHVSVDEQADDEKSNSSESMLKQLLLNPNDNYRKEVDSFNSGAIEHIEKPLGHFGNSLENKRQSRKIKKKKLPKKPFTELLKHLESPNPPTITHVTTKPKTRVLNAKSYLRQYGSAPASRANSPEPSMTVPTKKTILKPSSYKTNSSKSRNLSTIDPKKPLHVTKVYPISQHSQSPIITMKIDKKAENMIVAPDLNSLLDMFENESTSSAINASKKDLNSVAFRPSADKRKSAVLIDPLPKKRHRPSHDDLGKKNGSQDARIFCEKPSSDHDYCVSPTDVEGQSITNLPSKVIQWEDYLQCVRSGTRSAPNSPTSSPKLSRDGTRKEENQKTASRAPPIVSLSHLPHSAFQPVSPLIQANSKPTIKLQEFQDYLADLQNKRSVQKSYSSSAEIVVPSAPGSSGNTVRVVQASNAPATASVTVSLASGRPVLQQSKPVAPSQPFIQVQSGGKIHTAAVTSSPLKPLQSSPLVMIRIPTQSTIASAASSRQSKLPASVPTPTRISTNILTDLSPPSDSVSNGSATKPKQISTVFNPASRSNKTAVSHATQTGGDEGVTNHSSNSSPIFKLMTSSKEGSKGKSVILSNVTGQLKEILTALAQQQQNEKPRNENSIALQQKTLQKLLTEITNMNKNQSSTGNYIASSSLVTSCGTLATKIKPADCSNQSSVAAETDQSKALETEISAKENAHDHPSNRTKTSSLVTTLPLEAILQTPQTVWAPLTQCSGVSRKNLSLNASESRSSDIESNLYLQAIVKSTIDSLLERVVSERTADRKADMSVCRDSVDISDDMLGHSKYSKQTVFQLQTVPAALPSIISTPSNTVVQKNCATNGKIETKCKASSLQSMNNSISNGSPPEQLAEECLDDDQYYNKLPAYLYSGKLLKKAQDETTANIEIPSGDIDTLALGVEIGFENIEYNKLPHYFCSGKLAPREEVQTSVNCVAAVEQEVAFTTEVRCTPEGKVIDPDDTFYSRLPSYYSYGRTHVVDTVTEPPHHPDDTVTKESLERLDEERRLRLAEQERVKKRNANIESRHSEANNDHRILYSKLPSYLLSGRKSLAPERADLSYTSSQTSSSDSEGTASSSLRKRTKLHKRQPPSKWDFKVRKRKEAEKKNQAILQRRVMYVGGISDVTSKAHLWARFQKFGTIDDVVLYFRKGKDNYAFVTFRYSNDVIQAIERGNDGEEPKYTLCFGGRRHFCKADYSDLDDHKDRSGDGNDQEEDFDTLLRQAMAR